MSKRTLVLQRTLKPIAGGIFGLMLGSITGLPIASAFAPATAASTASTASITWYAAGCPAGVYTITSVAQNIQTGRTYQVTSQNVSMPRPTFVQQWSGLPAGAYAIQGTAVSSSGQSLGPSTQAMTVFDDPFGESGSGGSGFRSGGHGSRTPPPPRSVDSRKGRNTPPVVAPIGDRSGIAPPAETHAAAPAPASTVRGSSRAMLAAKLDEIADIAGRDASVHRIQIIDTDGDGLADAVTIEWITGEALAIVVRADESTVRPDEPAVQPNASAVRPPIAPYSER